MLPENQIVAIKAADVCKHRGKFVRVKLRLIADEDADAVGICVAQRRDLGHIFFGVGDGDAEAGKMPVCKRVGHMIREAEQLCAARDRALHVVARGVNGVVGKVGVRVIVCVHDFSLNFKYGVKAERERIFVCVAA